MGSSQRPRMSLPPELGDIDEGWGDDEQPTIARPSRFPTAPTRANIPDEFPTAPGAPIDIEMADDDDIQDRVTTVPEIPLDDYARRVTGPDAEAATEAPPPPRAMRDAMQELELTRSSATAPQGLPSGLDLESEESERHVSEMPTAPPPDGFNSERMDIPRQGSIEAFSLDPARVETDPPPAFYEKQDQPQFSGRFSSAAPMDGDSSHQSMKDKFAMGDFSGALELAEKILTDAPKDPEASSVAAKCREVLQDMYASRIAGLERVPQVIMGHDQIRWLSLDHRAGFMLSMIDGMCSVEDLLDVSGMQRLDALRIICGLLDQKVISVK